MHQQSQTTDNSHTSHVLETGTVNHRHLEQDFLNIFATAADIEGLVNDFLNIFATAADIEGSVNKIYHHTNVIATTYSD
jgi:hypothetical protein